MKKVGFFFVPLMLGACSSTRTAPKPTPTHAASGAPIAPAATIATKNESSAGLTEAHPKFEWPLKETKVINFFGWRRHHLHDGVDLRAAKGTPVHASAAGEVIHSGRGLRGYGRMVVIKHGGGWSTVYAHLSKCGVSVGDHVQSGEVVGLAGNTGHAKGSHLHFEVRKGADPLDPLVLLR